MMDCIVFTVLSCINLKIPCTAYSSSY